MYPVQDGAIAGCELFGCFLAHGLSGCQSIGMQRKSTCAITAALPQLLTDIRFRSNPP